MPDHVQDDVAIIQAAYAERISDAFKIFAENLGTGQSEASCALRFRRAIDLIRKTRDLALRTVTDQSFGQPAAAQPLAAADNPGEGLTAEDQALIDSAVGGTTGHSPAPPTAPRFRTY